MHNTYMYKASNCQPVREGAQIIELTMLAGLYHAVSFVVNVAGVEPEPWAPRWSR